MTGWLGMILALFLVIAGCEETTDIGDASVESVAMEVQEPLDDADITSAVEGELFVARRVPATEIDMVTENGVVTLTGTVDNILAKERAGRIAETIKGVRSVVNTIDVAPSDRPDSEIAADVEAALARDPATESWEVGVEVAEGLVVLSGTVESWQEKQLAARVAKGVRGVRAIDNEVVVEYVTVRSDAEIEADVEQALAWDARVDGAMIDVSVEEGTVMLTGAVGSAYERSLAVEDAWVAGTQEVVADDLEIRWWERDQMQRTGWLADKTDEAIADAVDEALLRDPRVAPFTIEVDITDGVATLTGTVSSMKAKRAAAQDAANTFGVWSVENDLTIRTDVPPSEDQIETTAEASLALDPYVDEFEVDAEADGGEVTLRGTVDTYFEKWQAEDVVAHIPGVTAIENALVVDYEAREYDVPFYDWAPLTFDYDVPLTTKTDAELRDAIQDELFWSPVVDEEAVTVTVDDGVATLTGTADTWYERNTTTEEAFEGGALDVENLLAVQARPEL